MPKYLPKFTIIRSKRKTLSLEVTREGKVLVRAPQKISCAYINDFVMKNSAWLAGKLEARANKNARENVSEEEKARLMALAREVIPKKVEYFAKIMGVEPSSVKITGAMTRWGSCSAKNALCFSWRLMLYPEKAMDYVVIHELSHILHHNHSREFWNTVAFYMPDYKDAEQMLRS